MFEQPELLPFGDAVPDFLKILPNPNDDGLHVNFGSSPELPHAGIIAIRNLEGKYLKVTPKDGLDWTSSEPDRFAKFEVKPIEDGKKIFLHGANDKFVNHYYSYILCGGPRGGWPLVVGFVDNQFVTFKCGGQYLSCVAHGDGLAVATSVNKTSKFIIEFFPEGHEF